MPQVWQALRQRREKAGRIGFVAGRAAKDSARTRVAKNRLGLVGPIRHVQGRQHGAEARNGVVDNHKFGRARQLNRDDVTRAERQAPPVPRQAVRPDRAPRRNSQARDPARQSQSLPVVWRRPALQPRGQRVAGPVAAPLLASHMLRPKRSAFRIASASDPNCGFVVGVPLHAPLGAKSPSAAQLEQAIITLRLEAPLLKQDTRMNVT